MNRHRDVGRRPNQSFKDVSGTSKEKGQTGQRFLRDQQQAAVWRIREKEIAANLKVEIELSSQIRFPKTGGKHVTSDFQDRKDCACILSVFELSLFSRYSVSSGMFEAFVDHYCLSTRFGPPYATRRVAAIHLRV
jgi:hypothetical protein